MRRIPGVALALVVSALMTHAQQQSPEQKSPLDDLKTKAEASAFTSTSSYDDVVAFMKAVAQASPKTVFYTTYGTTTEGRAMPLAIVGTGLKDGSSASVKASGKLRVHVQANVHAGEVEGKESSLVLLRELAQGKHDDWLRSMVFLITPDYNADGNEKVGNNRGTQNGPINGEGTRANAQGLNINRDYMKLDTPEARAFVKLWNDYDPQIGFDLHTSDGSYHGYYLTYSPPLNPDTDATIMKIMTDEWLPFVTKQIKAKHGWDTGYYGNMAIPGAGRGRGNRQPCENIALDPSGQAPEWRTFEHVPRFHNNYVGLRNRFGLLSEAYSYATFEDRIKATNYFVEEALNFANEHVAKLKTAIADADAARVAGTVEATSAHMKRGGLIDVLMGEVEAIQNPVFHTTMCNRKDITRPVRMVDMRWFEPATTETAPSVYYIKSTATKAIGLLKMQGIQMRQLDHDLHDTGLESFQMTDNSIAPAPFEGHTLRKLQGHWARGSAFPVKAGDWEIRTSQPLGRLAFYLLEPTSDDGVVAWNFLDDQLQDTKTFPVVRKP